MEHKRADTEQGGELNITEEGKTSGLRKPLGFSCEMKKLRRQQQQVDS